MTNYYNGWILSKVSKLLHQTFTRRMEQKNDHPFSAPKGANKENIWLCLRHEAFKNWWWHHNRFHNSNNNTHFLPSQVGDGSEIETRARFSRVPFSGRNTGAKETTLSMRLRHLSPGSALWVMPDHAVYYALNWKPKSHVIFIAVGYFFKDEAQNSILKMKIEKNAKSAMHWKILKKYIGQDIYNVCYCIIHVHVYLVFFISHRIYVCDWID